MPLSPCRRKTSPALYKIHYAYQRLVPVIITGIYMPLYYTLYDLRFYIGAQILSYASFIIELSKYCCYKYV